MTPSHRTRSRCGVCGFSEIRTDEVVDRGLVQLSECPRCEHRWTLRHQQRGAPGVWPFPTEVPALRSSQPLSRELSSAA
jgi:ribosomal protein S27AE